MQRIMGPWTGLGKTTVHLFISGYLFVGNQLLLHFLGTTAGAIQENEPELFWLAVMTPTAFAAS